MYELSVLFSIPDNEIKAITSLKYMFTWMLYHHIFLSTLRQVQFSPEPSTTPRHDFFEISKKHVMYARRPKGLLLHVNSSSSSFHSCPCQSHHQLHSFLNECVKVTSSSPSFQKLHVLFKVLLQELHFQCDHCEQTERDIVRMMRIFREVPESQIRDLITSPIQEMDICQRACTIHFENMSIITQQMRNTTHQEKMHQMILHSASLLQQQITQSLLDKDKGAIHECVRLFKNSITSSVDSFCPFVNVKKINFEEWLLHIVSLRTLCFKDTSRSSSSVNLDTFLRKIIVLLHLYFEEDEVTTTGICLLYSDQQEFELQGCDMRELESIHPLLRGEYIQSILSSGS